jgi:hypothetical protein
MLGATRMISNGLRQGVYMHPLLAECDRIGRRIYPYTEDTNTTLVMLTRESETAREQWKVDVERARRERIDLYERFRAVVPTLSVQEIVEGFTYGGGLLRIMLSGWMGGHYDVAYLPLMMQAIREGEPQVGTHCLSQLSSILGQELAPLVMEIVRKDWHPLQLDALYVAANLRLSDALLYAEDLSHHPNSAIAATAERLRKVLIGATEGSATEETDTQLNP